MKRTPATYRARAWHGENYVTSEHRALDAKDVRRLVLRDYPRADRIQVLIAVPSGDVVVEDWQP